MKSTQSNQTNWSFVLDVDTFFASNGPKSLDTAASWHLQNLSRGCVCFAHQFRDGCAWMFHLEHLKLFAKCLLIFGHFSLLLGCGGG